MRPLGSRSRSQRASSRASSDLAGRGPISTWWRRSLKARSRSKRSTFNPASARGGELPPHPAISTAATTTGTHLVVGGHRLQQGGEALAGGVATRRHVLGGDAVLGRL